MHGLQPQFQGTSCANSSSLVLPVTLFLEQSPKDLMVVVKTVGSSVTELRPNFPAICVIPFESPCFLAIPGRLSSSNFQDLGSKESFL